MSDFGSLAISDYMVRAEPRFCMYAITMRSFQLRFGVGVSVWGNARDVLASAARVSAEWLAARAAFGVLLNADGGAGLGAAVRHSPARQKRLGVDAQPLPEVFGVPGDCRR